LYNRLFDDECDASEMLSEIDTREGELFIKYKSVVETGKPTVFDWHCNFNGGVKWYNISVGKLHDGVLSTVEEITERRINEERVRQHAHFIQQVTNITPDFINVYDFDLKRHIYINKEIETVIGLSSAEFQSQVSIDLREVIHPDDFEKSILFAESLKQASDTEIIENTYRLKHVSGN
jgi:PAS domain-containing protein